MKFTTVFITLAAAIASTAALEPGPAPIAERDVVTAREALPDDSSPLMRRSCTPSSCLCNKVQGQFCGNEAINPNCKNGYVYECNGTTGKTCVYGRRDSCK